MNINKPSNPDDTLQIPAENLVEKDRDECPSKDLHTINTLGSTRNEIKQEAKSKKDSPASKFTRGKQKQKGTKSLFEFWAKKDEDGNKKALKPKNILTNERANSNFDTLPNSGGGLRCGWDADKQNCVIHKCPARKTVAKVEEWSLLKHGLYGKKSKNYIRWLCTESLYQLGENEPLEPAAIRKGISTNSPSTKRKLHTRTAFNLEHSDRKKARVK